MRYPRSLLLAPAALAAIAGPSAAGAQPSTEGDIVVTAPEQISRGEARSRVADTARETGGQLGRFAEPVCPQVFGMYEPESGIVESRIREIAREAGVELAGKNCATNLFIVMTDDVAGFVREATEEGALSTLSPAMRSRLRQSTGPAVAWAAIEMRNEDGQPQGLPARVQSPNGGQYFIANALTTRTASIVELSTQQAMTSAYVVFDIDAIIGKSLTQVADYAAMRGLAETRPPEGCEAGGETILDLFSGCRAAPGEIGFFDLEYLRALYRTRPTQSAVRQRASIAGSIAAASEAQAPGETPRSR